MSRSTHQLLLILAATFGLFSTTFIQAQTSFGRISGTITDQTGAIVPGADVVIKDIDTQATRTVKADASGFYSATELPIGNYTVQVNQAGFRPQQRTNIAIVADAKITVDFHLALGDVTQTVEVTAAQAETLNTNSGELSRVIDTRQVANLALNGRNYVQLMTLVPGAVVTNPDQFSVTTSLSATNQNINGNRSDTSNLTVDGAFNLVAGSNGSLMNNVSSEFVQEVKLETSNFSAEYGRMSGPAFNIVTKNGTNEIHGAAFEYFRNDMLDARSFFAAQKTELRFNDFGYDLGGPIIKNKFFFFVGEEWKRLRQQQTPTRLTIPDLAELSGNFSGMGTIYYPGTKTPVPGNNISSLVTPDGLAISKIYSLQAGQAATFVNAPVANNLTVAPSNPLNFREDIVRLDYTINAKNDLYGRWIQDQNQLIDPFGTFSNSNIVPTTPTDRMRPGESFLLAETWLPAPNIVNEARANASWASQHIPPYGNEWQRSAYGFQFPQLYSGGEYDNGIPAASITGFAGFQGPNFALLSPTTDIQFTDTVSLTLGNHLIKAGGLVIRDRVDQNGRPYYTGNLVFQTSGNPNTTGNAFADALLGNFKSYTEASADPVGFFRFTQPEAFVQDSWKVNSKLSLELGLRIQYMEPMYTEANNMANFVPGLYNPAQAVQVTTKGVVVAGSGNPYDGLITAGTGVPKSQQGRVPGSTTNPLFQQIPTGAPRGLYDSKTLFAPRFGFAYNPASKTVIRGGIGVFYDRPEGNVTFSQLNLPPFLQISEYDNGNLSNPAGGAPGTSPIGSISSINPTLQYTTTYQYSLGVQRELPWSMFLETTYVGNLGRHLLREPNINYPNITSVAANPTASTNAFVPYLGYSSVQQYLSDSTSNYNALEVYASKRAGNVVFTGGYTWSKALGDSSGEGDNIEDYQNRHFNYGPLTFDRENAFSGTFVWQLPMLRNQKVLVRSAAGGWQLSGVIRLQSGAPNTITASTAEGTRRANYNGLPMSVANPGPAEWFNTAAFAPAAIGAWGTSGTGIIRGPNLQSYDLSLAKHFALTERFDLKLQGDFFNAFNIVNWSTLNTTQTNSNFGTISAAYPARNVQLSLKLGF
ncbi:MAG TPA: carboxypeptidase-like regulatory domain-containing protein [Bryobacteraceae bacterium]|nr:carboxypeptidase-like regulatory domain-containing protein [Bryobacteraceae bacterium]